ncbi:gamma carbonic anhydrase family protein [Acrocarpospora phusangensis]|uniref:Gamma carbonic anhydrase family protein n=1 Tax=Acrocarpospora phusangensis TaxID=1070424 RepID=A0A919Q836_9ACTN|nr:gamma carbonic anhydrase family protein [Acrocarpospora phusangensis]
MDGMSPSVAGTAYVAAGAVLVGEVRVEEEASVWFNAVLRGDTGAIVLGARSNIQDLAVVHEETRIGTGVSVGHRATVHRAVVGDDVLVGMGAILLNDSRVGSGAIVAAGAVVREGFEVPPGCLVAGVPARIVREVTEKERESIRENAAAYVRLAARYRTM